MSCRVLLAGSGAPWKHSNVMPKTAIFEVLRGPRGVKIGPQRLLGPFLERLGLMEASWSALGRAKGTNEIGFGWPGGHIDGQKVPRKVPKLDPKGNQAENSENLKKRRHSIGIP